MSEEPRFFRPRRKIDTRLPHGAPLYCESCIQRPIIECTFDGERYVVVGYSRNFYGRLKLPGMRDQPCPNCGSKLVNRRKKRRTG